jgi:hypothetical protein
MGARDNTDASRLDHETSEEEFAALVDRATVPAAVPAGSTATKPSQTRSHEG